MSVSLKTTKEVLLLLLLLAILLVLSIFALPQPQNDKHTLCWRRLGGVCVNIFYPCPFKVDKEIKDKVANLSLFFKPLCHNTLRRCCVPKNHRKHVNIKSPNCGRVPLYPKAKLQITHGINARPHEFPWMVSLKVNGEHQCGGSVISSQWLVTAAHCFTVVRFPLQLWTAVVGEYYLTETNKRHLNMTGVQISSIEAVLVHKQFNNPEFVNDIAMIKLTKPFNFTHYVQPICLPNVDESFDNRVCTVTGFGSTEFGDDVSSQLKTVNLPTVNLAECSKQYCTLPQEEPTPVYASNLCAGFREGLRDACTGDSGGPLACAALDTNGDVRWTLAGVVSSGEECGVPNASGIYTRLTAYIDWIDWTTKTPFSYPDGKYSNATHFKYRPSTIPFPCSFFN